MVEAARWYRRAVFVSEQEVRLSWLPLDQILRHAGIDTTQPYTQRHDPALQGHWYEQDWRARAVSDE